MPRFAKFALLFLLAASILVFTPSVASSQNVDGTMAGSATDSSGSAVADTSVIQTWTPAKLMHPLTGAANCVNCTAVCRTPFTGNLIPATRFDPTALALLKFYPAGPNQVGSPFGNFVESYSTGGTLDQINERVDYGNYYGIVPACAGTAIMPFAYMSCRFSYL